jgi:hypothetical protein
VRDSHVSTLRIFTLSMLGAATFSHGRRFVDL